MDVRITHPNAPSNLSIPVEKLLLKNEAEKKSKYGSRVINTKRATFIPLVFTTAATTAPECNKFHKRVAELHDLHDCKIFILLYNSNKRCQIKVPRHLGG